MRGLDARALVVGVGALAAAACGGGPEAGKTLPASSPPSLAASAAPGPSAGIVLEAPAPNSTYAPPAAPGMGLPPPAPTLEMKSPVPSVMLADLQALALDPKNLPPIEKINAKALRGVMRLIAKSLGAKCVDCHREGDFAAATPRKKVAARMWDEFATKLALADGASLFCDSCHQGRTKLLNRTDKKALGRWMDANFVERLRRKDDQDHGCETCHVNMNMRFLTVWAGGVPLVQ